MPLLARGSRARVTQESKGSLPLIEETSSETAATAAMTHPWAARSSPRGLTHVRMRPPIQNERASRRIPEQDSRHSRESRLQGVERTPLLRHGGVVAPRGLARATSLFHSPRVSLPPPSRLPLLHGAGAAGPAGRASGVQPIKSSRVAGWPEVAQALAELAAQHAEHGRAFEARHLAYDALALIGDAEAPEAQLVLGETLLALHEPRRAEALFEAALAAFERADVMRSAARARLGLGRALRDIGDPRSRVELEDAGTLFEDLGDEPATLMVDRMLREVAAETDESPRSFHAVRAR